jgi:hypothetical protein
VTLAVRVPNSKTVRCPVIRRQNFSDKTFDVPIDTFNVAVTDSNGTNQRVLTLSNYLKELGVHDTRDDKYVYPDNAKNFKLRRDPAYPIRVTFQYYRAADSSDIPSKEVDNIVEQLLQPIKVATAMGSLVTDNSSRSTESAPPKSNTFVQSVKVPNYEMDAF